MASSSLHCHRLVEWGRHNELEASMVGAVYVHVLRTLPRRDSAPGAASRVTPERSTRRMARRCLSWRVLPQEGISSTHRLPYLVEPDHGQLSTRLASGAADQVLLRFHQDMAHLVRTNPQEMPRWTPTNGCPHGRPSTWAGNRPSHPKPRPPGYRHRRGHEGRARTQIIPLRAPSFVTIPTWPRLDRPYEPEGEEREVVTSTTRKPVLRTNCTPSRKITTITILLYFYSRIINESNRPVLTLPHASISAFLHSRACTHTHTHLLTHFRLNLYIYLFICNFLYISSK